MVARTTVAKILTVTVTGVGAAEVDRLIDQIARAACDIANSESEESHIDIAERDKTDAERFVDSVASTPLDGDEIHGEDFDYGGNDEEHEAFAEIVHEARARTTTRPEGYVGE